MKRIYIQDNWKKTWKDFYRYDMIEIYGQMGKHRGYSYAYQNRRNHVLSLIESVAKKGDSILDVAGGPGNFSLKLAELGYKVTWNDMKFDLAEYVEMKREKGSIEYKPGNIFDIKFDHLFDVVMATEIIEHVAHPDEFLAYLSTLVKPGGYVVMSTPLGSYFTNSLPKFSAFKNPEIFEARQFKPNSNGHIFLLHLDEVPALTKKSGLEIVNMKYYTNPLTNGHIKLNILLRMIPEKLVFAIEKRTQKLPAFIGRKIHNNFAMLLKKAEA
ncbi:MAG: methyltransferase domain-containing protein [Ferruginibacter sp.]